MYLFVILLRESWSKENDFEELFTQKGATHVFLGPCLIYATTANVAGTFSPTGVGHLVNVLRKEIYFCVEETIKQKYRWDWLGNFFLD